MVKQRCRECCRDISEEEYNKNKGYCNNCYAEKENCCMICGNPIREYEHNYGGICQNCFEENSTIREKIEDVDVIICENCYEENESNRTNCKNCGTRLFKVSNENVEDKIQESNSEDTLCVDNTEDTIDTIYNVKTIVAIIGVIGFIGSLLLFTNVELIGLGVVGLIVTTVVMGITSSQLKKKNKETYFYRYKEFIKQNKLVNCESVSYRNIVGIDIDVKNKLLGTYSYYESESNILKFEEILDFEIFENGNSVISSRSGSAVVGGLLFGGLGAVAGASGSRTINDYCSTLKLNIYTNKVQNSVITLDFLDSSISKNDVEYEELKNIMNKVIGFLKIAREDTRQKERKEDKNVIIENVEELKSNNSNLSSLKELAELKEQGIITEKEFEESKRKILSKI
jgi:hypothetical protein